MAMEDFRVDVIVGKGPGATAIPLEIPSFTLVGATTRAGLLPGPLRDRFGFTAHMDFYAPHELERVLARSARLFGVPLHPDGAREVAGRSRGTPRIANRLLRRVRDYAQVHGDGTVSLRSACEALTLYEVDESGLDRLDRAVLDALVRRFGGGPVGLSTLAVAVGRKPRPSRRWPSRSWSGPGCWRGPRGDVSRPQTPGPISAWPCPRGQVSAGEPNLLRGPRLCSTLLSTPRTSNPSIHRPTHRHDAQTAGRDRLDCAEQVGESPSMW